MKKHMKTHGKNNAR